VIDKSKAASALVTKKDVLRHAEVRKQDEFLIDDVNSGTLGTGRRHCLKPVAVKFDFAAIGLIGAGNDLDHCRLTGAVLPDQCVDFPGAYLEVDPGECPHTRKALGDIRQLQHVAPA